MRMTMHMPCKIRLTFILLWCTHPLIAQKNFKHHYFEGYAQVLSMMQDSTGFLWIRSTSRLGRFDGYEMQTYFDSLGNNIVGQLTSDCSGRLYVVDEGGHRIHRYNPINNSFESLEPNLKGATISTLAFEHDSRFWIGTNQAGLFLYDPINGQIEQFIEEKSSEVHLLGIQPGPNIILDIKVYEGSLLLGTSHGLLQFDKQSQEFRRVQASELMQSTIKKIFVDGSQFWFFTSDGLLKTDSKFELKRNYRFPKEFDAVDVARDESGVFWICSSSHGIMTYDPVSAKTEVYRIDVTNKRSIASDILNCVLIDREQNVWLGTYDQGFDQLKKQSLTFYNHYLPGDVPVGHPKYLSTRYGSYILSESKANGIWMAEYTDDPSNLQFVKTSPDLKDIHTNSSLMGRDAWWIGTFGKGLIRIGIDYSNRSPIHGIEFIQRNSTSFESIGSNSVGIWAEDKFGNLWISAPQNSLQMVNRAIPYGQSGSVTTFMHNPSVTNSISSGNIWGVLPEDDGSVWVLTDFNLDLYKNGNFRNIYTRQTGTSYNFTLAKSKSGTLAIGGTDGLSIIRYLDDGKNEIEKPTGLKGRVIYSLEEDQLGRWWCYGENGLFCYDPRDQSVIQFTEEDGLASNEGTANSSLQTPGGLMIFGNSAYTAFDPLSFQPSTRKYKPVITRLKLNNQLTNLYTKSEEESDPSLLNGSNSSIELNYTHRVVTLEFAALQYSAPEKSKYRYQLEGFDPDWVEAGFKDRMATYTNLEPGHYTFKVKATNQHGNWSDLETRLIIVVLPPPWRTWWAYTGYFLLLVGLLVWARRNIVQRERLKANLALERVEREKEHFELEKAKEVDRVKTSFFTNVSHEFRTPLTLIKGPVADMLQEYAKHPKTMERLQLIQRNSDLLLKLINQLLDLAKLESGSLKVEKTEGGLYSFVRAVASSFESLARQKEIVLTIGSSHGGPTGMVR
ncbi:MAG: hypothetical protein M9954_06610 [Cyclobacteriaceae bacterium]|nr:hypothetical protein [Cyclobacteriaceae bacterium]